jgi:UPF0755 protein
MAADDDYWGNTGRYPQHAPHGRGANRRLGAMARSPAEALEPDHAPEPPRGSKVRQQHPVFVFLNTFITLLLVGMIGMAALFYFVRTQFDKPGPLDHPSVVVIPDGDGAYAVARRLEDERIITDRRVFMAGILYFRASKRLKAGEYAIKSQASIREVLDTLTKGRALLYTINIPEGLTTEQIVDRLRANPELLGGISEVPPEGSLLPDTYKFARATTRDDMLKRMRAEQSKFIERIWPARAGDLPFTTQEEAIKLASIVEKETGRADERQRVAAVFVNRLKKKMRLESDPTVTYGIVGGRGPLGRGLMRSELDQVTPYNTYRVHGLPPTPIANPGRAALEAVLKPARTGDLFFVADGTGGHAFAENLREHNKNVERWRGIERERQEAKAQTTAAEEKTSNAAALVAKPAAAPAGAKAAPIDIAKLPAAQIPLPQRRPSP